MVPTILVSIPCKNGKIKKDVEQNGFALTTAGTNNNAEIICSCDILERMWQKY